MGLVGGMAGTGDRHATVGLRYRALVKERGISAPVFDAFLTKRFPHDKSKINTFLRDGQTASRAVRHALITFASEMLHVDLPESWFDAEWHPSAPIDVFLNKNRRHNSVVEHACGHYLHISAKAPTHPDNLNDKLWRVGRLLIEDNDGFFGFKMGSEQGATVGDNPFSGFIACHSDTLFLTGFDTEHHEKSISLILRIAPKGLDGEGVKFCGLQVGTLPLGNMPNGRAVAKHVVIVKETTWTHDWKGGKSIPKGVLSWLTDGVSPLTADLIAPRLDE
jgi:hypothetical protein